MEKIILEVDDTSGRAYQQFSPETKSLFTREVNTMLKKIVNGMQAPSHMKFLDKVSAEAEKNGLTPQLLKEILEGND